MVWLPVMVLSGAAGPGPDLEARPGATEGGYELRIIGRVHGWPEGPSARIRFRWMVNRLEGPEGILAAVPEEASWVRSAVVRQGTFAHRETFSVPGRVQVEAFLDPEEQGVKTIRAAAGSIVRVFDVASPWETALALRHESRLWQETMEEAGRLGGPTGRERALRRLGALRRDAERVLFSATRGMMAQVLEEFLNAGAGRGNPGPHAGVLALRPEDLPAALAQVRACFGRERRILTADVAGRLAGADPASGRRMLEVLRQAASDDGDLLIFLEEIEGDFRRADLEGLARRVSAFSDRARRGH